MTFVVEDVFLISGRGPCITRSEPPARADLEAGGLFRVGDVLVCNQTCTRCGADLEAQILGIEYHPVADPRPQLQQSLVLDIDIELLARGQVWFRPRQPLRPRRHLWQVDHDYYCSEGNYYSNDTIIGYASWAEFMSDEGDNDLDLNLVFRWDWGRNEYCDGPEEEATYDAKYDDNYRAYTLKVFWMGQRKGLFRCTVTSVCRADEPAVIEWLRPRLAHLVKLWEPVT